MWKNIGSLSVEGNKARSEKLSPEVRQSIARSAAKARWDKYRLKKNHVCDYACRCTCGVSMLKHSKYSECQNPKCTKII